jgi:hypothetical protein
MSKTVPRWVTVGKAVGGIVALVAFFWQGLPFLLQKPFEQAVSNLAAPHEAKAAMEHAHLEQLVHANELEHQKFVQRLEQDERQWSEFMRWYGADSAEKERQLLDIQQGMRRLLEQQTRENLRGTR